MLKRIPYNDSLIQIGNAVHQSGSPVWSDGRVVYGRVRNPQLLAISANKSAAGFWVNEQDFTLYKLCKENLQTTGKITADAFGMVFAYPYYADELTLLHRGYVANNQRYYRYTGGLIYLDNTGHSITYDRSKIYFNAFSNSVTRDSHGYAVEKADAIFYDSDGNQEFVMPSCAVAVNNDFTHMYFYSYDDDLTSAYAEYNNGHITSQAYTGAGTVSVTKQLWLYNTDTTIVDISMLESDDPFNPSYIFCDDGILSSNTNRVYVDIQSDYSALKTAFQVTKYNEIYAYVASKTYDQNNLLMMYCVRIELRDMHSNVLWSGAGIVTEDTSTSKKYAYIINSEGNIQQIAYYENQTLYYNSNSYPNGDIAMAGLSYPYLTQKQYKIFIPGPGTQQTHVQGDSGNPLYPLGLTEDSYPSTIIIDGILTVNLSNFSASATIDGHRVTLTGDVFELSQVASGQLCFPSGLHALMYKKKLYVICQSAKKIFRIDKNGSVLSASYNGIGDCFSLARLIKRWNRRKMY